MHFALPPRKTSHPPPYARTSHSSSNKQKQILATGGIACAVLLLIYLAISFLSGWPDRPPPGTPEAVVVTVIDQLRMSNEYIARVKENRRDYAVRHGYSTFFPNATDYDLGLGDTPRSWSTVPATRHAMTLYPHSTYFFVLSPHAMIMNPRLSLTSHIMSPKRLESLMLKDKAVVPPDSVIKTFSHLKGENVDVVLTQDGEGLCQGSFIIRRGEWAQFFLDSWFDPLYRSYNFQKAEGHALEHIVQWHPTILTKLALIPQKIMNSYSVDVASRGGREVMFTDADFVVRFIGCDTGSDRNCEQEAEPYYKQWKGLIDKGR